MTANGDDGISIRDTLTVDPATGDVINPWHFTTSTDTTFVVTADQAGFDGDAILPEELQRFYQPHTLILRALDDQGGVDPDAGDGHLHGDDPGADHPSDDAAVDHRHLLRSPEAAAAVHRGLDGLGSGLRAREPGHGPLPVQDRPVFQHVWPSVPTTSRRNTSTTRSSIRWSPSTIHSGATGSPTRSIRSSADSRSRGASGTPTTSASTTCSPYRPRTSPARSASTAATLRRSSTSASTTRNRPCSSCGNAIWVRTSAVGICSRGKSTTSRRTSRSSSNGIASAARYGGEVTAYRYGWDVAGSPGRHRSRLGGPVRAFRSQPPVRAADLRARAPRLHRGVHGQQRALTRFQVYPERRAGSGRERPSPAAPDRRRSQTGRATAGRTRPRRSITTRLQETHSGRACCLQAAACPASAPLATCSTTKMAPASGATATWRATSR